MRWTSSFPRAWTCVLCANVVWAGVGGLASAACIDEDKPVAVLMVEPGAPLPPEPRVALMNMVRDALGRSHAVGATLLLAQAALSDIDEARAAKALQASVGGDVGPSVSQSVGITSSSALHVRGSISVTQLLYDGGRTDRLTDWRTQLAESARLGHLSTQEQIALNTVALGLERSRFRQHVLVYGQYVRKMACLVEALETIVRADRGRASELVQAKKSLQQAELAQHQALSQVRQVETRLRRFVGDGLPSVQGMSSLLLEVPELGVIEGEVTRSTDMAQLAAQAAAMGQYAAAVASGDKPQLSWTFGGSKSLAAGGGGGDQRSANLGLGILVNIPLANPGVAPAAQAARQRAQAAQLQREDALESRRYRAREVHEQTLSAFDRATRLGGVLRESDQVRSFTLQQWQQLGKRSMFDVMSAEGEHYNLRVAHINAMHDGQQMNAVLLSLGRGVAEWLR